MKEVPLQGYCIFCLKPKRLLYFDLECDEPCFQTILDASKGNHGIYHEKELETRYKSALALLAQLYLMVITFLSKFKVCSARRC